MKERGGLAQLAFATCAALLTVTIVSNPLGAITHYAAHVAPVVLVAPGRPSRPDDTDCSPGAASHAGRFLFDFYERRWRNHVKQLQQSLRSTEPSAPRLKCPILCSFSSTHSVECAPFPGKLCWMEDAKMATISKLYANWYTWTLQQHGGLDAGGNPSIASWFFDMADDVSPATSANASRPVMGQTTAWDDGSSIIMINHYSLPAYLGAPDTEHLVPEDAELQGMSARLGPAPHACVGLLMRTNALTMEQPSSVQ